MRIGFTCGVFDLFNAGHILMLSKARQRCDYLMVGIQTDPTIDRPDKHKPVQSVFERSIEVGACRYVDKVIIYQTEQDLWDILDTQPINVRFIGKDHEHGYKSGDDICKKRGIKEVYLSRGGRFSTTELRERVKNADN
jgi:glycerol-3-phosphate cytidylyltransferase